MNIYCKCCKCEIKDNKKDLSLCKKCLNTAMFGKPADYLKLEKQYEKNMTNIKDFDKKYEIFEEVLDILNISLCDHCNNEIAELYKSLRFRIKCGKSSCIEEAKLELSAIGSLLGQNKDAIIRTKELKIESLKETINELEEAMCMQCEDALNEQRNVEEL